METQPVCPSCQKTLPPETPLGLCPECLIKSGFKTGADPVAAAAEKPRFVPPPVEEIARLFPQLEVISLIGQGGMGAVYKARQPALDRFVALKVLPPGVGGDPGFAERFNREARALARLSHPHIVAVHDFGCVRSRRREEADQAEPSFKPPPPHVGDYNVPRDGIHYLMMEFVDGANLRQVEQAGRLAPEQALQIVPQICEALQFAHNEGIVHRDIKPENILMDKKGRVKITDFGIAKILAPTGRAGSPLAAEATQTKGGAHGVTRPTPALTGAKDVVGTPHYMAPEQVEHPQMVDHRADIYSLGVVFYEMLTGELPLGKFAPPSKKVHVDVRLDEVVLRTLEKEPELRYQQASEVKTQVETIVATAPSSSGRQSAPSEEQSRPTSAATTPPRFSRTAIVGAVWAILFLVGMALLAALTTWHPVPDPQPRGAGPVAQPVFSARLLLIFSPLLFPILAAPFATTILGWTAVSQIRRSAGRLYGLGLAVFDGLLFPLLALDAFIFGVIHSLTGNVFQGDYLAIALLVSFVFDWRIAWWVWRAVNKSAGASSASPGTPTGVSRSRSAGWTVARIVLLHAAVLVVAAAFFAFIVPLFGGKFADWGAPLPRGTLIVLHFSDFVRHGGFLLILVLLAADLAVLLLLRRFAGRELVGVWAYVTLVVFIIPLVVGMWGVFAPFTRVTAGITRATSDTSPPVRGSLSRTTNNLSVVAFHENNATLRFAIFHAGNFRSALRGGSIGGNVHVDEGSIALPNGQLFVLRCESSKPEQLKIDGREFDLHAGRVLVLRDDGHGDASVEQLNLFPPLSVARDPEALAQLIREQKHTKVIVINSNAVTFGPVIERVVNDQSAEEGSNGLDLDLGKLFTLPEPRKADFTWMLKNGIDVICAMDGTASQGALATGGTVAKQIPNERWETIGSDEIVSTVLGKKPDFGGAICLVDKEAAMGKPTLPVTFVFRTREGGMGVLQVLAHTENPRGVKLRYKLVQGDNLDASAVKQ